MYDPEQSNALQSGLDLEYTPISDLVPKDFVALVEVARRVSMLEQAVVSLGEQVKKLQSLWDELDERVDALE